MTIRIKTNYINDKNGLWGTIPGSSDISESNDYQWTKMLSWFLKLLHSISKLFISWISTIHFISWSSYLESCKYFLLNFCVLQNEKQMRWIISKHCMPRKLSPGTCVECDKKQCLCTLLCLQNPFWWLPWISLGNRLQHNFTLILYI